MKKRATVGDLFYDMRDFAMSNESFAKGRSNRLRVLSEETLDFGEYSRRVMARHERRLAEIGLYNASSDGVRRVFDEGELRVSREFQAQRLHMNGTSDAVEFSGYTSVSHDGTETPLHIARRIIDDSDSPVEDIGPVRLEHELSYKLSRPDIYKLGVNQSFTVYDDEDDAIYHVCLDEEMSGDTRYVYANSAHESGESVTVQVIPEATLSVMQADGNLTLSDEEWLALFEVSGGRLERSLDKSMIESDLQIATTCFADFRRSIRQR